MNGPYAEVDFESDYESDFESDFETDFESDFEDYPESRRTRRRPQYRTPRQPQRGPGGPAGGYTRPPTVRTPVTHEQLRQALVRVKQDIDRVATGVRANTANLNDFAGRTGRNLNRMRDIQRRDVARLDRSVSSTRELSILGSLLASSADDGGANLLLPLIIIGMEQPQPAAPGAPADGLFGGGSNATMLLALAATGVLTGKD